MGFRSIKFHELSNFSWFTVHGTVYQKLPNLNGSNCYQLNKGYRYMNRKQIVQPINTPSFRPNNKPKAIAKAMITLYDDDTWRWGKL